jgi:hypothetical protein
LRFAIHYLVNPYTSLQVGSFIVVGDFFGVRSRHRIARTFGNIISNIATTIPDAYRYTYAGFLEENWTIWWGRPCPDHWVFAMAVDPTMPSTIYADTERGDVFRSTDGGGTWVSFATFANDIGALAVDPSTSTLYVGTFDSGIFAIPLVKKTA